MCITFIKISPKDKIKFIIGFNREVELTKPTKQAGYWPDDSNILGGLDLALGGACLALNVKTGHIAILTNFSELPPEKKYVLNKKSRGDLVRNWVKSNFYEEYRWTPEEAAEKYMEMVLKDRDLYNPFNFIVGKINDPEMKFHALDFTSDKVQLLEHGKFVGMSNSSFACPYAKLSKGLEFLNKEDTTETEHNQKLHQLLHSKEHFPQSDKYDPEDSVFVSPFWSIMRRFIIGTISTTIITVDSSNQFTLDEKFYTFPQISNDYDQNVSSYRKLRRVAHKLAAIRHMVKANEFKTVVLPTTITGQLG